MGIPASRGRGGSSRAFAPEVRILPDPERSFSLFTEQGSHSASRRGAVKKPIIYFFISPRPAVPVQLAFLTRSFPARPSGVLGTGRAAPGPGRCRLSRHTPAARRAGEGALPLGVSLPSLHSGQKSPPRPGGAPRPLFAAVNHITEQSARVVNFIFR